MTRVVVLQSLLQIGSKTNIKVIWKRNGLQNINIKHPPVLCLVSTPCDRNKGRGIPFCTLQAACRGFALAKTDGAGRGT